MTKRIQISLAGITGRCHQNPRCLLRCTCTTERHSKPGLGWEDKCHPGKECWPK